MYDVVQAPTGTGRFGRIEGVEMAGKTGTAEFGSRSNRRRHTWMTVFAPYADARYTVAMVVEEGLSGGRTVAPRIQALMTRVFQIERMRQGEAADGGAGGGV
jgi:peptidoglycan glycosyltransferase